MKTNFVSLKLKNSLKCCHYKSEKSVKILSVPVHKSFTKKFLQKKKDYFKAKQLKKLSSVATTVAHGSLQQFTEPV